MSVNSCMSSMSVSINGQEIVLESALDDVFKNIQIALNSTHCNTREACMILDQDASFKDMVLKGDEVIDTIDEIGFLFKDLKSIIKQVMLKPQDDEEKTWLKSHINERKLLSKTKNLALKAMEE